MADIEKQKKSIIEKLQDASQSIEKMAFIDQDISNLKLTKLNLKGHIFRKCNFYVSKFISCIFEDCEFLNCNFSNTDLLNVKFINCTFVNCNFTEATLQDVLIEGGFKSNNTFAKMNIKDNVIGIEEEESNIISDDKNKETDDKLDMESLMLTEDVDTILAKHYPDSQMLQKSNKLKFQIYKHISDFKYHNKDLLNDEMIKSVNQLMKTIDVDVDTFINFLKEQKNEQK